MPDPAAPRTTPNHALAVYAEPLVAGRRVVVVGDASELLDERLLELGARVVHVYDPDAARAERRAQIAPRGATVRALPEGDFGVRDGAFDVALVTDLGAVGDAASLVARVRRLVGAEGVALFATSPSTPGLDYYELYDVVSLQFASVRMVGRVPFFGVALAELGDEGGAPDVSVDTQLVAEPEPPEGFIAVASQRDQRLAPYAIVQLARPSAHASSVADGQLEIALAEASVRAEVLGAQLDELRARSARDVAESARSPRLEQAEEAVRAATSRAADAEARAQDAHGRSERLALEVRALEGEVARQRDRVQKLAGELDAARAQRGELEVALVAANDVVGALRARAAELEVVAIAGADAVDRVVSLEAELDASREAITRLEAAERSARAAGELAVRRAAAIEQELSRGVGGEELARFEEMLRERAQAIFTLEKELARRERMVQELVAAVEASAHAPLEASAHEPQAASAPDPRVHDLEAANAELRRKLDALALEVTRREGALQSSAWKITELEQKLASRPSQSAPNGPNGATADALALEAAETQIDVLKRALAQEHEARRAAEARAAAVSTDTAPSVDASAR